MTHNTPIDEYSFWKNLIEEMQGNEDNVPEQMFELMDNAERKTLYYLLDKYQIQNTQKDGGKLLH